MEAAVYHTVYPFAQEVLFNKTPVKPNDAKDLLCTFFKPKNGG